MPEASAIPAPIEVTDLDLAFPASVKHLLPPAESVPDDKWGMTHPFARFASRWFYNGLPNAYPSWRDGIDHEKAIRHLRCIMGSFEPKHEHKIGGVAQLLEAWCDAIIIVNDDFGGTLYTPGEIVVLTADEVAQLFGGDDGR